MRIVPLLLAAVTAVASGVADAGAQALTVRPLVLIEEDPAFGVRLTSSVSRSRLLIGPFPREWHWSVRADAPLYLDPDRNPETIRARLDGGLQLSLFRPSTPAGAAPSPDDPPPWNYGYITVGLTAGVEAPQQVNTADVTAGGVLAYEHDQYHGLWFVPELRFALAAVFCMDCDGAAGDDGRGARLDGSIGWNVPADRGWVPDPLKPLWLRLRGRAFSTSGLEGVDPVRNDDGLWGSAELAYRCDRCGPLHEVYVRGHGGRLPLRLREKRAFTAGVALWF
jgi:hypothetical protein